MNFRISFSTLFIIQTVSIQRDTSLFLFYFVFRHVCVHACVSVGGVGGGVVLGGGMGWGGSGGGRFVTVAVSASDRIGIILK